MKHLLILATCFLSWSAQAETTIIAPTQILTESQDESNMMDELNPFDNNIQETLKAFDQDYFESTGQLPIESQFTFSLQQDCYRLECSVYAHVVKAEQKLYLYLNGRLEYTWFVSSGGVGHTTPDFDKHPDGRIYDRYTSTKFPGGNYNGLGNMPYAVFIKDGFAIHGTTQGNFSRLGTPASHGCVRVHPENGKIFNRLVRQFGVRDVWVTIE